MQCVIGAILAVGSFFLPESPRYDFFPIRFCALDNTSYRWLIDTDKDSEGMRVIVDLHGGDPEDAAAKAEFREIKDKVMSDVCALLSFISLR